MADIADQAGDVTERERESILARRRVAPPAAGASGPRPCSSCGEEIEPARARAMPATTMCAFCAGAAAART